MIISRSGRTLFERNPSVHRDVFVAAMVANAFW